MSKKALKRLFEEVNHGRKAPEKITLFIKKVHSTLQNSSL